MLSSELRHIIQSGYYTNIRKAYNCSAGIWLLIANALACSLAKHAHMLFTITKPPSGAYAYFRAVWPNATTNEIIYIIFVPGQKQSSVWLNSNRLLIGTTGHIPCVCVCVWVYAVANGNGCRSLCRLAAKHMAPDSGLLHARICRRVDVVVA